MFDSTVCSRWVTVNSTRLLAVMLLLAFPVAVQAQFTFTTNSGAITITGYTGPGGAVTGLSKI
jgi:hypothetical protein